MGQPLSAQPPSRARALAGWRADWAGLRTVVLGLGATGFAYADTLRELGAEVDVLTAAVEPERLELSAVIGARVEVLPDTEMPARLAELAPELVLVSPGFAAGHPAVAAARAADAAVWGELELAWRLRDKSGEASEWLLVAGGAPGAAAEVATDVSRMLQAEGASVAPAGLDGVPILDAVRDPEGFGTLVVAASSPQLAALAASRPESDAETPGAVVPIAAAVLAYPTTEHPDTAWHGGTAERHRALGEAYHRVRVACVFDHTDDRTRELVEEAEVLDGARAIGVGLGVPGPSDLGVVEGILVDRAFLVERRSHALELGTVEALQQLGRGTPAEVKALLTSAALARAAGAGTAAIASVLGAI